MADELGITKGAYSKIERGLTAISVDRLAQIAAVFHVDITSFFREPKTANEFSEQLPEYGFATKGDLVELVAMIDSLRAEIVNLKKHVNDNQPPAAKKK